MVGSIGVIQQHDDLSEAMAKEGVKTTLITAGKKKASGNPFEPLSEEAKGDAQAKVDTYYSMFLNAVAKGRGISAAQVRNGYGEGDVVLAQEAKRLGMVDRIETLDQAIVRVARSQQHKGVARALVSEFQDNISTLDYDDTTGILSWAQGEQVKAVNLLLERRREMLDN
jgi:ClpP class serine protease